MTTTSCRTCCGAGAAAPQGVAGLHQDDMSATECGVDDFDVVPARAFVECIVHALRLVLCPQHRCSSPPTVSGDWWNGRDSKFRKAAQRARREWEARVGLCQRRRNVRHGQLRNCGSRTGWRGRGN